MKIRSDLLTVQKKIALCLLYRLLPIKMPVLVDRLELNIKSEYEGFIVNTRAYLRC